MVRVLLAIVLLSLTACEQSPGSDACGDGVCTAPETYYTCAADCPEPCNYDCICDSNESRWSCSDCFNSTCSLEEMDATSTDSVVQTLRLPVDATEASSVGVDIDRDGIIDNQLGVIFTWLADHGVAVHTNELVNERIASGELLLVGRLRRGRCGQAATQLLMAEVVEATPLFDGYDTLRLDPAWSDAAELYHCADWESPLLDTSPSWTTVGLPLVGGELLSVTLVAAQVRTVSLPDNPYFATSAVTPQGWTDVMLGGGLSPDELQTSLLPALAARLTARIAEDATSTAAAALVALFDGQCDPSLSGCEHVESGVDSCDDSGVPPEITFTELWCNAGLRTVIEPDVDSDGDGEPDVLSVGLRIVNAVPVTVVE